MRSSVDPTSTHLHSSLRNQHSIFHRLNGQQPRALAAAVYAYAANIDNLPVLSHAVEIIAQKHTSLLVKPEHYSIVGNFLIAALKQVLGEAFSPIVEDAWSAAYWQLAHILMKRESELYEESKKHGWEEWKEFVVERKEKESEEIVSFYLIPKEGTKNGRTLPNFKPGSYISIRLKVPQFDWVQPRQYSLSDAPGKDHLRISVKREAGICAANPASQAHPGWISNVLHDSVKVGDVVEVSYPRGEFYLDQTSLEKEPDAPIVFISAGVGLTPLTSMLNSLVQHSCPSLPPSSKTQYASNGNAKPSTHRPITWIHAARSSSTHAFGKQVSELVASLPNAHEVVFIKSPSPSSAEDSMKNQREGRMDLCKLDREEDLHLDNKKTRYYICGPTGFMHDMVERLKEWGVDEKRLKYEVFGAGVVGI
jgi:nitric oxide dioxygenase